MDQKDIERLEELNSNAGRTSNSIIKDAFKLLSFQELGVKKFVIVLCASILLALLISARPDSQSLIKAIAEVWQNVALAIFGIAFTAYSIFQALLSPKLIHLMVRTDDNEDKNISSFSASNKYFISYMALSFVVIAVNVAIFLCSIVIPDHWNLFVNKCVNNVIFFILVCTYFYLTFCWLIEIKSIISNIHNMYNVVATDKYIEELEKNEPKNKIL